MGGTLTVGDGEGHALSRAAAWSDLAKGHHCGGDEARRQVGGVCGEEYCALLPCAAGCGGGRNRRTRPAFREGCAAVLRGSSA